MTHHSKDLPHYSSGAWKYPPRKPERDKSHLMLGIVICWAIGFWTAVALFVRVFG